MTDLYKPSSPAAGSRGSIKKTSLWIPRLLTRGMTNLVCSIFLVAGPALAAEPPPARLFFSDAKISFTFPNHWTVEPTFPYGPLFTKETQQGSQATISVRISEPLNQGHLSADATPEFLKRFVEQEFATRKTPFRILSSSQRTLAGQNCYEITWEDLKATPVTTQSEFFFIENRVYALTLTANSDSFLWLVPDFQGWLNNVRVLSRRNAGSLDHPARGGFWVHQTGGAKFLIPEEWLIGVADDRTLGIAFAKDKMHLELTASLEVLDRPSHDLAAADKEAMRAAIEKKGFKVLQESEEPFHGYPAYHLTYEGTNEGRYVRGQDVWVRSPKARWLINAEGDGPLYRQKADELRTILNDIQFL